MSSNIDDVGRQLDEFLDTINFETNGINGSLGLDIAHAVAEAIAEAGVEQETTVGGPFPENEPKYAEWKDKKYNVGNPAYGRRTGQMLSLQSLLGKVDVTPTKVVMTYGTGEPPARSAASDYISDADKRVTDREKAEYNHARMNYFYQVGRDGAEGIMAVLTAAVERAIEDENRK